MLPYHVTMVLCSNGERLPTLIKRETGVPDFDATLWVVSALRKSNLASSTIEQALRSVSILYTLLSSRGILLSERAKSGKFLSASEVDLIIDATYRRVSLLVSTEKTRALPYSHINMERLRAKNKSSQQNTVHPGTAAIRLFYIGKFLSWRFEKEIAKAKASLKSDLQELKELIERKIQKSTPHLSKSSTLNDRLGLTPEQLLELDSIVQPESPLNPWNLAFTRPRNHLITQIISKLGIRRSELLGLRVEDFSPRNLEILIHRRPDDIEDPRLREPNSKTNGRGLKIDRETAQLITKYLPLRHKIVKGRHSFLIVSNSGTPLSTSELNRIFTDIRKATTLETICPHTLRHTYFEILARDMYQAGFSENEMMRILRRIGGWSDTSQTPRRYIKRFIQEQAAEASLSIQSKIFGTEESQK
ncbi:tyrosine-type recombinase/integrase [Pseudomonas sp. NPDC086581]|uniref:tyrosine-type recombinase/integrase n=1 Tax=Pseudomonas sp. NPDC086581 TaxID=3364432 RepID=UPI003819F441